LFIRGRKSASGYRSSSRTPGEGANLRCENLSLTRARRHFSGKPLVESSLWSREDTRKRVGQAGPADGREWRCLLSPSGPLTAERRVDLNTGLRRSLCALGRRDGFRFGAPRINFRWQSEGAEFQWRAASLGPARSHHLRENASQSRAQRTSPERGASFTARRPTRECSQLASVERQPPPRMRLTTDSRTQMNTFIIDFIFISPLRAFLGRMVYA